MIYLNVTIIYDSSDHKIYDYAHFLLNDLHKHFCINLTEYFLSEDFFLPHNNYCQYSMNKHCNNNHSNNINKIAKSINDSDLIIFACSNLEKQLVSPQLKLLLNHLYYLWIVHKNNTTMNEKIALVISDNYIPFFPSTYKVLKKNFKLWGIKNILNFSFKPYNDSPKNESKNYKNYLNLVFLSLKILNLIYNSNNSLSIKSKNVINFPYSKLTNNKSDEKNNNSSNKVISMKISREHYIP